MGLPLFLCVLSMAAVTCTPYVPITTGAVTLSADAVPIPGGYVVPERGNVTFTCNSSNLDATLLWTVDLRVPDGTATLTDSTGLTIPQVSSMDAAFSNPTSITVQNVSSENNCSLVECSGGRSGNSSAAIIVEGSPNCPTVYTTVNTTFLAASIRKLHMTWLPEWYCVEVISYNDSIAIIVHNSALKANMSFNVTPLQPSTVYNISIIPCNVAGCNNSCDIHSVQMESDTSTGEPGSSVIPHGDSLPLFLIIIIVVAILVAMALLLLAILGSASVICLIRRRGNKQKGAAEQGCMKPQIHPSQPTYAETAMVHKAKEINSAVNNPEYAEVAHSTKSAKRQLLQGSPRQAHSTCVPGTGASPTEYATVADAVSVEENVSRSQSPLKHTPSLPPFSPPSVPPCSSPDINVGTDCVQDAGYASLPDSQGSKRITKVRSIKQKANQMHASSADSPANMC